MNASTALDGTSARSFSTRPQTLVLDGLRKSYGAAQAVDDVSLQVPGGSLLALLGPSGCGKTTILRSIAGFVAPDQGRILIDNQDVTALPPERRGTAMVFQNYALFPHMTVAQNVGFGLRVRGIRGKARDNRVRQALAMVRLMDFASRYPAELSGGQQQRAALARAIVTEPRVLLLDEPFGALDQNLREDMQVELRALQQRLGVTAVVVTHDQQEAMILADQIAVMRAGRIEQLDAPHALYDRPATRFVASFIGAANILDFAREGDMLRLGAGTMPPPPGVDRGTGSVTVAIRPEAVRITPAPSDPGRGIWIGRVASAANLGGRVHYDVVLDAGPTLRVEEPRQLGAVTRAAGSIVGVQLDPAHCAMLRD